MENELAPAEALALLPLDHLRGSGYAQRLLRPDAATDLPDLVVEVYRGRANLTVQDCVSILDGRLAPRPHRAQARVVRRLGHAVFASWDTATRRFDGVTSPTSRQWSDLVSRLGADTRSEAKALADDPDRLGWMLTQAVRVYTATI